MRRAFALAITPLVACQAAPEISDLAVYADDYTAGIAFLATDAQGDLDGGQVLLDFGGHQVAYGLTSDDPAEEKSGTIVSLPYRYSTCLAGETVQVSVTLEDAAGERSNPLLTTVLLGGDPYVESEPNDDPDVDFVGSWAGFPIAICGELDRTGVDANNEYREADVFEVRSQVTGKVDVTLQAPLGSEFDLWIFDENGNAQTARWMDANPVMGFQWSTLDLLGLHDDEVFWIVVGAGEGSVGQYSVFLE